MLLIISLEICIDQLMAMRFTTTRQYYLVASVKVMDSAITPARPFDIIFNLNVAIVTFSSTAALLRFHLHQHVATFSS